MSRVSRGGTPSMIVASVCNEHCNSDLRADNPDILRAFNERFKALELQRDELLEALKRIEGIGFQAENNYAAAWEIATAAIEKAEGR